MSFVSHSVAAAIAEKAVLRALAGKGDSQMLKALLPLLMRESKQSPVKLGPLPTRTAEDNEPRAVATVDASSVA